MTNYRPMSDEPAPCHHPIEGTPVLMNKQQVAEWPGDRRHPLDWKTAEKITLSEKIFWIQSPERFDFSKEISEE